MQRLVLVVLLLAAAAGIIAILAAGWRAGMAQSAGSSPRYEGNDVQKLAYAALILLITGASTGLLGGL